MPMYVDTVPNRNSPPGVLLRESWREGDKTRKRTLANLSHWPAARIELLRRVLKGETLVSPTETLDLARFALCDTTLEAMLVASHIVPWSEDRENRLNPRNGILFCRTHDCLFDIGIVRVNIDLSVTCFDVSQISLGQDLHYFLIHHTGSQIRVPLKAYSPDPSFLRWRSQHFKPAD